QGAPFGWQWTAGLGVMSLATVPNDLEAAALNQVRAAVVAAANAYVERATRAYGTSVEEYVWGSNSEELNAGMVMALAYDLTGEAAYRAGALGALDYVLGRNPLGRALRDGIRGEDLPERAPSVLRPVVRRELATTAAGHHRRRAEPKPGRSQS